MAVPSRYFLDYYLHHLLQQKPEIIYFELGGNELDSSIDPDYLVHLVLNTTESLLHNNTELIIFGEVFDMQLDKTFQLMNIISSKLQHFNYVLKSALINSDFPRNHPHFR